MVTEKEKDYMRQYRIDNKERIAKLSKIRYDRWIQKNKKENKEYMKLYRQATKKYKKQYRIDNRDKIAEYRKQYLNNNCEFIRNNANQRFAIKYKIDLKFNLNEKISSSIRYSLKGNKAGSKWESIVNYTLDDLKNHLQKTLPQNYTWGDFLQGKLHIDHIIPISAFNFSKLEHPDFKKCWALKNLRLLPAKENLIKGSKLFKPFQPALKISLISKPVPIPA